MGKSSPTLQRNAQKASDMRLSAMDSSLQYLLPKHENKQQLCAINSVPVKALSQEGFMGFLALIIDQGNIFTCLVLKHLQDQIGM